MNLLVNALSCTNLSGRQVLCGHLAELLRSAAASDRFVLLIHPGNRDIPALLSEELGHGIPPCLSVVEAPGSCARWPGRLFYERTALPALAERERADVLWSLSGTWTAHLPCPQVTSALNPWALVPTGPRRLSERVKAALQRHAYRLAVRRADGIGYGSEHMRDLYRANAGAPERLGAIVYPALSRSEASALDAVRSAGLPRDEQTILCVSLMARHKDLGTLLRAVQALELNHGLRARLRLVGGWAEPAYRREMEALAAELGLADRVEIPGHLPRQALREAYASARVYALLSRSESFGIPSVEAQRMGTPVVAATGSAAPEVCGAGGLYVPPGDAAAAAAVLHRLLADRTEWQRRSEAAAANARRFEYGKTTLPLGGLLRACTPQH